jgi:hypothetical protein
MSFDFVGSCGLFFASSRISAPSHVLSLALQPGEGFPLG